MKLDKNCELIWTKIKVRVSKDLYVGSFYRPPNNADAKYLDTIESYLAWIQTHNGAHLWVGDDFNIPGIDWTSENIKTKSFHRSECNQLLEISKNSMLDQLVLEPTRIT